ncbi:MAG: acyloxyacyl hydrolase [Phycisphaerae bacterium]|nr:acyloxyacyl hydrolase [Phycisphaerae bacterium]
MNVSTALPSVACAVVLFTGRAAAETFQLDPAAPIPLSLGTTTTDDRATDAAVSTGTAATPAAFDPTALRTAAPRWGDAGTWTFNLSIAYANDFDETSIVPGAIGVSWFPIRMFSIDLQAEGAYIAQPGDDAGGGGLALVIRWHFLDYETWSLYADLGIGILATTTDVPPDSTQFVFTPRAGVGASFALSEDTRLLVGARWFHISNAQTASNNPGINALEGYAGVSFAF